VGDPRVACDDARAGDGWPAAQGSTPMEELLRYIASVLVDHPEEIKIARIEDEAGAVEYRLSVCREDVGKVIGKQGRTARAIRSLVQGAAALRGERVNVHVVDD
jgi:predicted RNA-binding protein YlqC (UPF0109 family)